MWNQERLVLGKRRALLQPITRSPNIARPESATLEGLLAQDRAGD